jgi:hypothetical protein
LPLLYLSTPIHVEILWFLTHISHTGSTHAAGHSEFLPYLKIYFIFVLVAEKTLKLNDQVLSQWPERYRYQ